MCDDDREEGEIVDDEFEDISDNSIILPSGKSHSSKDHLRALCLNSASDCAPAEPPAKRTRRKLRTRKRRRSHRKTVVKLIDVDSDLDLEYDRLLQEKLKAAVHINKDNEELHKNSLRTRLMKGMTNDDDKDVESSISEPNAETVSVNQNSASPKSEPHHEDYENELNELRLEALRTTFVNKYKNKKRQPKKPNNELTDTNNKENTEVVETSLPDEDEDVLRAKLLASISKQLISKTAEESKQKPPVENLLINNNKDTAVSYNFRTNNINKFTQRNQLISKNRVVRNFNTHDIKITPIIITLSNSDSDDDTTLNTELVVQKDNINKLVIEDSIEKFLQEQRAKVEAEKHESLGTKPKEIVSKDIPDNAHTPKVNNKALNALKVTPKNVQKGTATSEIVEKSAVKLLPKSKQLEYQRLLLKLRNAQTNGASKKIPSPKLSGVVNKDIIKGLDKNRGAKIKAAAVKPINGKYGLERSEAVLLQTTIKGMQAVVNKRLQIKGQYKPLKQLLARINESRKSQKKYDQDVKRLTEELAEAKRKQLKAHEEFSLHLKELVTKKQDIDKGTLLIANNKSTFTSSTPVKEKTDATPLELSAISRDVSNSNHLVSIEQPNTALISGIEDMVIEDPNDIDRIINRANYLRQITVNVASNEELFMKYSSPLDMVKSEENEDPFSILCPFEVDGTCKDRDCTYKHFLKR